MKMGEFIENENVYLPPTMELLFVEVEKGFAGSQTGTEGYDDNKTEIEF